MRLLLHVMGCERQHTLAVGELQSAAKANVGRRRASRVGGCGLDLYVVALGAVRREPEPYLISGHVRRQAVARAGAENDVDRWVVLHAAAHAGEVQDRVYSQ